MCDAFRDKLITLAKHDGQRNPIRRERAVCRMLLYQGRNKKRTYPFDIQRM